MFVFSIALFCHEGDHGSLRKIDLSGANIVSGGSSYIRDEDGNKIYSSNDTIGERMFYECVRLNEVVLPTVAKYIGKSAFESCRALKSVTIPETVKGIGEFAFYYCDSINNTPVRVKKVLVKVGNLAYFL